MKIGYFADGPWSHRALDQILQHDELKVVFIVARYDKADPVLREFAQKLHVPFYLHPNVNSEDFISKIAPHGADIHVSMSFDQILKKGILSSAPLGFINCHAGALPFYRGRNIINWALVNDEKKLGVTVHHVDEGIDTGDIILQEFVEISDGDTYRTMLDKAIDLCASVLPKALLLLANDSAKRIKQTTIHEVGFYCSQRKCGDEWIDWNQPSRRIHNFVRAITAPGPAARTSYEDKKLAILETELIQNAPHYYDKPGTVVGRDERGCIVKTADTTIRVLRVASVGEQDQLENERIPTFRIGTQFKGAEAYSLKCLEKRIADLESHILKNA